MEKNLRPVVFLDRDGVINEDRDDYVKNVDELVVFPYSPDSIARLNNAGYVVVVVSNQQCVAKGMMTCEQLEDIQREITRQVNASGGDIESFQHCTHLKSENCSCRKPKPGMLLKAIRDHQLDPEKGFMVGDNEKDIIAGRSVGCRSVLVMSGMATRETVCAMKDPPDYVAENLQSAVDWILSQT
jgi:histidinol-phosphate phosphatase family protein